MNSEEYKHHIKNIYGFNKLETQPYLNNSKFSEVNANFFYIYVPTQREA